MSPARRSEVASWTHCVPQVADISPVTHIPVHFPKSAATIPRSDRPPAEKWGEGPSPEPRQDATLARGVI